MERIVGLILELQEPLHVLLVGSVPGVVVDYCPKIRETENRWDVVEDCAQQGVGCVDVLASVVMV